MCHTTQLPPAKTSPPSSFLRARLGVVSLHIAEDAAVKAQVEKILKDFHSLFLACHEHRVSGNGYILCLIIKATTNDLGSLTGKLGMLQGIRVKSILFE